MNGSAAESTGELTVGGLADYVQKQMRRWGKETDKVQTPDLEQYGAGKIVLAEHLFGGHAGKVVVNPVDPLAHINITSDPPGARVYVDDQVVGTTPCTLDQDLGHLKTKQIEVTVEAQGYRSVVRTVSMERGTTADIDCPLEPIPLPKPVIPAPPAAATTRINPKDGAEMVYVPAGEFLMGSTDAEIDAAFTDTSAHDTDVQKDAFTAEGPQRRVYLDGYWIYKTDVTVAQYRKFCEATGREMPAEPEWGWKDDHPMVNVTWYDAKAYCEWVDAALPTEAQWEKAARGTEGGEFPWGNGWDRGKLWCSIGEQSSGTTPVGTIPGGASPYGVLDMAGNVYQWCADWYDATYYRSGDNHNPPGPADGQERVLRGGSWIGDSDSYFRSAYRVSGDPSHRGIGMGFRAVRAAMN
jgi:formylglycine-generating enzyme required for sulfatase activity